MLGLGSSYVVGAVLVVGAVWVVGVVQLVLCLVWGCMSSSGSGLGCL